MKNKTQKKQKKSTKNKKVRAGDKVVIIAGNHRGETGTVLKSLDSSVVVQGINLRKKHVKKTQENPQGGVLEIEKPIHISNVQPCDSSEKPVKLKVKYDGESNKVFYYKKDGQEVDYRPVKKHQPN